jgi:hypothetical protein
VSTSSVSGICGVSKVLKYQGSAAFLSSRKSINIPNRATNLGDFEKDVIRRTAFEFYDRGECPTPKK